MQVKTWFATFTLDGDRIIDVELFNTDIDSIVKRLMEEPLLLRGNVAGKDIRDLALEYGFVQSKEEYDLLLHELNIELAKKQAAKAAAPDRQVIAVIDAIDDIDETSNILAERLEELYLLNFNETPLRGEELAHPYNRDGKRGKNNRCRPKNHTNPCLKPTRIVQHARCSGGISEGKNARNSA